jgi:hypothetical protein
MIYALVEKRSLKALWSQPAHRSLSFPQQDLFRLSNVSEPQLKADHKFVPSS